MSIGSSLIMDFKVYAAFFLVACQLCWSSRLPPPQEKFVQPLNNSVEYFRHIYSRFPCSDRVVVDKMFDIFKVLRAPKIPGHLESEEAEMELLYLMVFGKSTNVPLTRFYLIFEKLVESLDKESPSKDDREKVNDQILRNYLTAAQIKRLHIFTRYFEPEARPYDVKVLLTYLYGIPCGLALGVAEDEISLILEKYERIEDAAIELAKRANKLCADKHRNGNTYQYNDYIVRDLLRTMLTSSN